MPEQTPNEIFAEFCDYLQDKYGWNASDLSGFLGWDYSTVYRLKRGDLQLTPKHLEQITQRLDFEDFKRGHEWYDRLDQAIRVRLKTAKRKSRGKQEPLQERVGEPRVLRRGGKKQLRIVQDLRSMVKVAAVSLLVVLAIAVLGVATYFIGRTVVNKATMVRGLPGIVSSQKQAQAALPANLLSLGEEKQFGEISIRLRSATIGGTFSKCLFCGDTPAALVAEIEFKNISNKPYLLIVERGDFSMVDNFGRTYPFAGWFGWGERIQSSIPPNERVSVTVVFGEEVELPRNLEFVILTLKNLHEIGDISWKIER